MVGFFAEMSASPLPLCPIIQISSSKSIEYISDSCPIPDMVLSMLIAIETLTSPSTAHATPCFISIENAGISMLSSTPALPCA